jgi:hypothetical protein
MNRAYLLSRHEPFTDQVQDACFGKPVPAAEISADVLKDSESWLLPARVPTLCGR